VRTLTTVLAFFAFTVAGCSDCPDNRFMLMDQCPCGIDGTHTIKDSNGCPTFACIACPPNMDMGTPDLSRAAGCTNIGICMSACTTPTCEQGCLDSADPFYAGPFGTSLECGVEVCGETGDGGSARCVKSGSVYADPPGAAAGTCKQCLADVLAPLFGVACSNASSPDCMEKSCHTAREACSVP
jgi:hypothetical protein